METGVNQYDIQADLVPVVVAAMTSWMQSSPEGLKFALDLLNFDWEEGKPDTAYKISDGLGRLKDLASEELVFFRGAMVRGVLINPRQIMLEQRELNGCDSCGILSHCTKVVTDQSGRPEHICNHCTGKSEHQRVRDEFIPKMCSISCPRTGCEWRERENPEEAHYREVM